MENLELNEELVEDELVEDDLLQYTCDNCGSIMVYEPSHKALHCKSCNTTVSIDIDKILIIERDYLQEIANKKSVAINEKSTENEVVCKNCGAVSIYDGVVFSDKCAYCGSFYVYTKDTDCYIKAEYLLPFEIGEKDLYNRIEKFCKSKFFMNKEFKEKLKKEKPFGVYIPYWTFDSYTISRYTAQRGDYYYVPVTRRVNGKTVVSMERRTRWRRVKGVYELFFDDIVVSGIDEQNFLFQNLAHTFDTKSIVPYDSKYLLGFSARKYDVDVEDAWNIARVKTKGSIEGGIRLDIGGDEIRLLSYISEFNDIKFKHVLLPVWIYTCDVKNKVYKITVNGQMGKIVGKYPLNIGRIIMVIVIMFIVLLVILYMLKI